MMAWVIPRPKPLGLWKSKIKQGNKTNGKLNKNGNRNSQKYNSN